MKNISLKTKIVTGLITGGMILSNVSTTFATTTKPLNVEGKSHLENKCNHKVDKRQQGLETNLKKLVTEKTLTQDQSDKIRATIIKAKAAKKANFEKTKTMTEEQRKAYFNSNKTNYVNPLKALVDNGTITQAQADKVGLRSHHGAGVHNHKSAN